MEAVAAAASIAGILTLVFQSIDGLHKFKELFSDASSASRTISRLLDDINSLIRVLEDVRDILEQFEAQKKGKNFASLDIKLADCSKDIRIWLSTARLLRPSGEHGGRAWLKKFRLAVNKDAIQTIRDEIGRHRQIICLSLSVLGRNIDLDTSEQVYQLGGSVSQSLSNYDAQEAALRRIENYSRASLHSTTHSIRSLDAIREEVSRLEARMNGANLVERASLGSANEETRLAYLKESEAVSISSRIQGNAPDIASCADSVSSLYTSNRRLLAPQVSEQITKDSRSSFVPATNVSYKSSFLYASFSASASPPTSTLQSTGPREIHFNTGAVHEVLQQSLSEAYPPCIAEYISLANLLTLCTNHLELLRYSATVHAQSDNCEKLQEGQINVDTPSFTIISNQIKDVQHALKALRRQCIQAGYSLSMVDQLLVPVRNTHHEPVVSAGTDNSDEEDWKDVSEG